MRGASFNSSNSTYVHVCDSKVARGKGGIRGAELNCSNYICKPHLSYSVIKIKIFCLITALRESLWKNAERIFTS